MAEKNQKVSNPLTIIAIFAGLAEVVSTAALAAVDSESQILLIWFVVLFPVFLASAFFLTLNFNPQVLYAPSDFQNDENFLTALRNKKSLDVNFSKLTQDFEDTPEKIVESVIGRLGEQAEAQRQDLKSLIEAQLNDLSASIQKTEESANIVSLQAFPHSELQAKIVANLYSENRPLSLGEISNSMNMSESATGRAVGKLVSRGLVLELEDGNYELNAL